MAKKMKEQRKKIKINSQLIHLSRWLSIVSFIFLGILIFYPPFFRGLFFQEDMFLYHIFTAIVFFLILVQKLCQKDFTLLRTPLEWAILAYTGAYLLSLIGAVHPGEAFYGFLRGLNYFMVFWMVIQAVKNFRDYKTILQIILAAGTGVALIGILAATGYSDYPAAFNGWAILSTLQYPNTTAAYLAVVSLLAVTLITVERKLSVRLIYTIAAFMMILVILCTLSKGAWVIFGFGAILLLIVMPGSYKISSLWVLMVATIAAGAAYTKFYPSIIADKPALAYLLIGVSVIVVGMLVWEGLFYIYNRKGYKVALAVTALMVTTSLGVACMILSDKNNPLQAGAIVEELTELADFSNASYTSRADFIRWGLDIVKDHPVNGTGAGGWNALYHNYQDYLVFTTEAHNHFIQVWVEAGTIGLLAFLAIWVLFFRAAYQTYYRARNKGNIDQQVLVGGTFAAAVALGIHSAIDFDLSMSAMALVLWILFALVSTAQNIGNQDEQTPYKFAGFLPVLNIGIAILCVLLLSIYGCSFYIAHKHAIAAGNALQAVSFEKPDQELNELFQASLQHYERATQLNPLNAEYHAYLAYIYALFYLSLDEAGHELSDQVYQKAVSAIEKAAELKPYSSQIHSSLFDTTKMLGDFTLALQQAEGLVQSNPNDINAYETLVNVLEAGLEYCQEEGNNEQTALLAHELVEVQSKLEEQKSKIDQDKPWNGPPLTLSAEVQYSIAKANYLLGNYEESLAIFRIASPDLFNEEVNENTPQPVLEQLAWYAASLYKTGNTVEADNITRQLKTLNAQVYSTYERLIDQEPLP